MQDVEGAFTVGPLNSPETCVQYSGRVKLEDEAFDLEVSMDDFERLDGAITWIDLSFVERERTPGWAIQVGVRCHLAGMSNQYASQHLEELGPNTVMSQSTTGFTRRIYSRSRQ